jgi:PAS domain S-box-containing protein
MPNTPTSEQLNADNHDLRARLEKAEATLSEILSGEADALYVTGAGGAQLFTLKGADQSYRKLIENMSEGALTLTPAGLVLYANRRFAEMLKTPLEKVIGSEIHNWIAQENRQVLQVLLLNDEFDNHREELALTAADGAQVPVYLSVSRLVLDEIDSVCMVVTDLTEQKRNEAILAAEKLSNAILEQAADAIVICDKAGRIMRASRHAQEFCGNSPLGQLFEQAFPLCQLDGTVFFPVGTIDTNRSQSVEARLEHDGQEFDLLVSVGHLKGARDELLGSVVTLTDITERKRSEELVYRKQSELRVLIDLLPAMIWFKDTENRILRVNKHVAQAAGMSVEEIEGKPSVLIYPQDAAKYFVDDLEVIESGKPKLGIVETVRAPVNKVLWVQTDKVPFCDKDGKVLGICVMAQDITERKQAELDLIESERRFSELLENVELISVMLDRDGKITYCNDFLLNLTDWQYKEVLGRYWFEVFVPPEQKDLKDAVFAKMLVNLPEVQHHENEILTRSGERRLIHWNNSVLRSGAGDVIGTASIGEDITERKKAEVAINQRAAELERFHRLSVGRELQMIGLKKRINELAIQAGQPPPHDLAFLASEPVEDQP